MSTRSTSRIVRIVAAGAAVAVSPVFLATPAHADAGRASVTGSAVVYDAASGYHNDVRVSRQGTTFLIDDTAPIRVGSGCSHPNPRDRTLVWCAAPGATRLWVFTWSGNDRITSDVDLPSVLDGGVGDDRLQGSNRGDTLRGGPGRDELYGQRGDDVLSGGPGNDRVYGWHGNDTLYGEIGNDVLSGQNGDDSLYGNAGNDSLDGGSGANRLRGGAGRDSCVNGPDIVGC